MRLRDARERINRQLVMIVLSVYVIAIGVFTGVGVLFLTNGFMSIPILDSLIYAFVGSTVSTILTTQYFSAGQEFIEATEDKEVVVGWK